MRTLTKRERERERERSRDRLTAHLVLAVVAVAVAVTEVVAGQAGGLVAVGVVLGASCTGGRRRGVIFKYVFLYLFTGI